MENKLGNYTLHSLISSRKVGKRTYKTLVQWARKLGELKNSPCVQVKIAQLQDQHYRKVHVCSEQY